MKNIRFITILALAMLAGAASCKKENPRGTHEIAAARTLQEKVILSAAQAGATLSDVTAAAGDYTVTFHVPFLYEDENKTYESVTLLASEISDVTQDDEKIIFTFVDRATASLFFNSTYAIQTSLPTETKIKGYPGEKKTLAFEVTDYDPRLMEQTEIHFLVNELGAEVEFNKMAMSGTVTFTVPETETACAKFTVTNEKIQSETIVYTITATPYHFELSASGIIIGAEAGATAMITCTVETDIPDYKLEYTIVEGDFFSLDGNTVTATKDNDTNAVREGAISIDEASGYFEPVIISVSQEILPDEPNITTPEGCVVFTDKKMKSAMVGIADTDGDGEVSFDEALQVKEIEIVGKGVQDLTGLEAFSNAWKLDARDNDIIDARIVSSLPRLYWLDLTGNANLEEIDITGCSLFFEHCDFEKTEKLNLTILREQVGPDPDNWQNYKEHVTNVWDDRESTDYSQHKSLKLVHEHTKGKGTYPVVISGLGWLDVEVNNGTFDRMTNYFVNLFSKHPDIVDYWDYLDVYIYTYISDSRKEYESRKISDWSDDREEKNAYFKRAEANLENECFGSLYGDASVLPDEKKGLIIIINSIARPGARITPQVPTHLGWMQGALTAIRLKNSMINQFYLTKGVCETDKITLQPKVKNYTYKEFYNKEFTSYETAIEFFGLPE